jgi:L-iditol 2-dehydrogenase
VPDTARTIRATQPRRRDAPVEDPRVRALIFHGPGDLRLEDVPDPVAGPGDALVQVEVALTDGTDLKALRRGHPVLLGPPPSPFGHEFCGIDTRTGRRVVAANSAPCRTCPACLRGQETLCESLLPLLNGAYAELVVVPERIARTNLLPVPPGLAPELAAMTEPLACCLRGIDVAGIDAGDTVAIVGLGPIGLMLAACVADAGAHPVAIGGRPERRALAPLFGAEIGDGAGADVVIEAAGTVDAWERALALVRPGGTVLAFSGLPRETRVAIDPYRIHYEEVRLVGSFHHTPRHVRAALAFLASGAVPFERLVTHRVGLKDVAALLADPPSDYLKAAVVP